QRGDVEVAGEDERVGIVRGQPRRGDGAQPVEPLELVGVVRVVQLAAVGDVEGVDADPAGDGGDRAGLGGLVLTEPGHLVETDLHVVQAHAGGDGDAVPLV